MQKVKFGGMEHLEDVNGISSTNTASTLETLGFTVAMSEGATGRTQKADIALIYFETNAVRVGAGTPSTSKGPIFEAGEFLILESAREIEDTKFVSAVVDVHATIHAQIGYTY